MGGKKAFVFSEDYFRYDYGPYHPLRMQRLKLAYELIQAYGLLGLPDQLVLTTQPATLEDVAVFHRPEYIDLLRRCNQEGEPWRDVESCGLGQGDNPIFDGLWDWSLLTTGASLQCARIVADNKAQIAFNIAGGLHHAMPARASGFCYVNDIVVAIYELLRRELRVAYLDVDAHHGDGVQDAFYDTDQVLTISLHQHGRTLFPGTGFVYETGRGRGMGYAVNIPLYPGTDDEIYLSVFRELVPDLLAAYEPDVLVTQLGVDTLYNDPLANLSMTTQGFLEVVGIIKDLGLPWVALGGGGYHIVNVARAWTLAWARMNDADPPDPLPESFLEQIRPQGYRETRLRDKPLKSDAVYRTDAETVARQVIQSVRETVLPGLVRRKNLFRRNY